MSIQKLLHPTLGPLLGVISSHHVMQFRSIPYARIPARFQQAEVINDLGSEHLRDFTSHGPACPQKPQDTEWWGGPLPEEKIRLYDEFGCLTVTVSTPTGELNAETKRDGWPVMVYIHGGGLVEGMGSGCPRHDMSRMVELSIQEGTPVVCVSIKYQSDLSSYRLNYFGFLASKDLLEESQRLATPFSNFGLHDQRLALTWIRSHVSGFGGSPRNITVFGESAGSVSIFLHMCSPMPLFCRAILMSGTVATIPLADLDAKEEEYRELLRECGIEEKDQERLQKLREVPVDKLIQAVIKLRKGLAQPVWDGDVLEVGGKGIWAVRPTYTNQAELIAKCSWVEGVVTGDAFFEGFLLADYIKHVTSDKLISHYTQILGEAATGKILDAYQISPGMEPNLFWTRSMMLAGDLFLSEPMHALANSLAHSPIFQHNKRLHRYTTTVRHPFPGTTSYQIPGPHAIDLFFVFTNLIERLPTPKYKAMSVEFARRWIAFANGADAWEQCTGSDGEKIAVVDGREGWVVRTRKEDDRVSVEDEQGGRRYRQWEVLGKIMRDLGADEEKARRAMVFVGLI